ncbi:MAG: ABC transporter ATP-binding protein [Prevotella sp.]|jgi:ABC-2 type transport system ATP-binding protein|nr:ABC transporter ATP-binding protein [Prevotella sp.]
MNIYIKDLRKAFGEKVAVDIDTYEVKHGEMMGLVGNNGAGKTTLFRLMLDLLKADSGNVEYQFTAEEGETPTIIDPSLSEEWKSHTGAYIDDGFLIDFLTPEEYFDFIGKVSGLDKTETENRIHEYDHLMAGEILDQKKLIRDFSAGNKQKIGIISALLHRPELVILDEPFNFLDPSSQNVLKHTLVDYNKTTGATIIISSHNLAHTIDICPRITLLEHGKIVKDLSNENHSAEEELNAYFDQ